MTGSKTAIKTIGLPSLFKVNNIDFLNFENNEDIEPFRNNVPLYREGSGGQVGTKILGSSARCSSLHVK